jgi:hypothetical protein
MIMADDLVRFFLDHCDHNQPPSMEFACPVIRHCLRGPQSQLLLYYVSTWHYQGNDNYAIELKQITKNYRIGARNVKPSTINELKTAEEIAAIEYVAEKLDRWLIQKVGHHRIIKEPDRRRPSPRLICGTSHG